MKKKPYPRNLPPMPKGQVFLGKGGDFKIPQSGSFLGRAVSQGDKKWEPERHLLGGLGSNYYCAPADSEVARLNGLAPAKKAPRKAAKKAKSRVPKLDYTNAVKPVSKETPDLVLEVGKTYLTRGGENVRILCVDLLSTAHPVIGAIKSGESEEVYSFTPEGLISFSAGNDDDDIISLAPDFDWSCLPPWINYIVMEQDGDWVGCSDTPKVIHGDWINGNMWCPIPKEYAPTNQPSDWRQSLRVRPEFDSNEK